jgi:hypothetical protein
LSRINEILIVTDVIEAANKEFGDVWVMPTPKQCLMYSVQEWAEANDAWMRSTTAHFRNNERPTEWVSECCDVMMMMSKFVMQVDKFNEIRYELAYDAGVTTSEYRADDVEGVFFDTLINIGKLMDMCGTKRATIDTVTARKAFVVIGAFYDLMPYEGFYLETMEAKMDKYRTKIAAKKLAEAQKSGK